MVQHKSSKKLPLNMLTNIAPIKFDISQLGKPGIHFLQGAEEGFARGIQSLGLPLVSCSYLRCRYFSYLYRQAKEFTRVPQKSYVRSRQHRHFVNKTKNHPHIATPFIITADAKQSNQT